MSPEVLEGQEATRQSDLYSTGVTIYRMLTGKRPVGMPKLPSKVVAGLSRRWDTVTRRCLANTLEDRYASAEELLKDLRKMVKPRRAWMAAAVSVLTIVGLVGAASLSGMNVRRTCTAAWTHLFGGGIDRGSEPNPLTVEDQQRLLEELRQTLKDQQRLLGDLRRTLKDHPEFADPLRKADEQTQKANSLWAEGKKADACVAYGEAVTGLADAVDRETQRTLEMLDSFSGAHGYASKVEPLKTRKAQADTLRRKAQYTAAVKAYLAVIAEVQPVLGALGGEQEPAVQDQQRLLGDLRRTLKDHPEFADPLRRADERTQKADTVVAYGEAITGLTDAVDRETQRNLEMLGGFSGEDGYAAKVELLKTKKAQADARRRKAEYAAAVGDYLAVIAGAQPLLAAQKRVQEVLALKEEAERERAEAEEKEASVCVCPPGTAQCVCFQKIYG